MRCAPEATTTTRSRDVGQQQVGQREVAEVVGAELHLEAVLGAPLGDGHHAGVVDQDVEVALPRVGERADRGEVGEVERAHLGRRRRSAAAAASPLATSRTASTTRAPARPSSRAAARPMPLLAPVTTKVRPSRRGRSCAVHLAEEVMPSK